MLGALKLFGLLLVNIGVAVVGAGILDTAIGKTFHAHSLDAILWKEWSLSIGCAAGIGFGMWRKWRSQVVLDVGSPRSLVRGEVPSCNWERSVAVSVFWGGVRRGCSPNRVHQLVCVRHTFRSQRLLFARCLRVFSLS